MIELSQEVYRRLSEQAAQLHLTPEELIEQLLATVPEPEDAGELIVPPAGSEEALAAVRRLSTLFAGVAIPNLEAALADPMLALTNTDLDTLAR